MIKFVALLAALLGKPAQAIDSFPFSRLPFNDTIPTSDIPQFITITFDDSVTPYTSFLFSKIARTFDPHTGCNLKATFYVSIEGNTRCEYVQGLRKGGHEIATHTLDHIGLPSIAQIQGAVDWLANNCGVPAEEMRGFRTPFLNWGDTTLQNLNQLGLLYDSSIGPTDHAENLKGRNHTWPFTLEQENIIQFKNGKPGVQISPAPGLWEIPMWSLYDSSDRAVIPMDYPNPNGPNTVIPNLIEPNFLKRYNGNRAPFGLFFHASWLLANGEAFATWIQQVMDTYDDVFFVTSYEVLQWMRNPVPASQYVHSCPDQKICFAPRSTGCLFGTFNGETCECDCMAPYCKGPDGACTEFARCPTQPTTPVTPTVSSPVTLTSPVAPPVSSPVSTPVTTPVSTPVSSPPSPNQCCPVGFSGFRAWDSCKAFYRCLNGSVLIGSTSYCANGLLFDSIRTTCNWAWAVSSCEVDTCGGPVSEASPAPSPIPLTTPSVWPSVTPSLYLSAGSTVAPISPISAPSMEPSLAPVITPPQAPTPANEVSPPIATVGCCSQNALSCISWCGTTKASCQACGESYTWLANGPPAEGSCLGRFGACKSGKTPCCPGLFCEEVSRWYSRCAPSSSW